MKMFVMIGLSLKRSRNNILGFFASSLVVAACLLTGGRAWAAPTIAAWDGFSASPEGKIASHGVVIDLQGNTIAPDGSIVIGSKGLKLTRSYGVFSNKGQGAEQGVTIIAEVCDAPKPSSGYSTLCTVPIGGITETRAEINTDGKPCILWGSSVYSTAGAALASGKHYIAFGYKNGSGAWLIVDGVRVANSSANSGSYAITPAVHIGERNDNTCVAGGMKITKLALIEGRMEPEEVSAYCQNGFGVPNATQRADYTLFKDHFTGRVFTWAAVSAGFHDQGKFACFDLNAGKDGDIVNGSDQFVLPGCSTENLFWHGYCNNSALAGYVAPGLVLRIPVYGGDYSLSLKALFGPFVLGGLLVEEGACGGSVSGGSMTGVVPVTFISDSSDRETAFGDPTKSTPCWFVLHENVALNRKGATTIYGEANFVLDAGKVFDCKTDKESAVVRLDAGAVLKMHGKGVFRMRTLTATGSVTLDYSDLDVDRTMPFLDCNLILDGGSMIVLPDSLANYTPYPLCSGTLSASDLPALVKVGSEVRTDFRIEGNTIVLGGPNTWTGAGDGVNWSSPGNWSAGIVPIAGMKVVIQEGKTVTMDVPVSDGVQITGAGRVIYVGKQPGNEKAAYRETSWTGTVEIRNLTLSAGNANDTIDFASFSNAKSSIALNGVTSAMWSNGSTVKDPVFFNLEIGEGGWTSTTAWITASPAYYCNLIGGGTITERHNDSGGTVNFIGDHSAFSGSIICTSGSRQVALLKPGASPLAEKVATKIVIGEGVDLTIGEGKTWQAAKGFEILGTVGGAGTLKGPAHFSGGAVCAGNGVLTLDGTVSGIPTIECQSVFASGAFGATVLSCSSGETSFALKNAEGFSVVWEGNVLSIHDRVRQDLYADFQDLAASGKSILTWTATAADATLTTKASFAGFDPEHLQDTDEVIAASDAWHIFYNGNLGGTAYRPGSVLRLARGRGIARNIDGYASWSFGGIVVEPGATGYSMTINSGTRDIGLGDQASPSGITWTKIYENFAINRGPNGKGTFYGICNLLVAAGKTFNFNASANVDHGNPVLNPGATLKMHGDGLMQVNTLIAEDATLDYSDLSLDRAAPFIKGDLKIDGDTHFAFPAALPVKTPYALCSGVLSGAPDTPVRTQVTVGTETKTLLLSFSGNTVAWSDAAALVDGVAYDSAQEAFDAAGAGSAVTFFTGADLVVNGDKTVRSLAFGASASISGEGSLTVSDGATFNVGAGATLTLSVPVTLEGVADKQGAGTLLLNGLVSGSAAATLRWNGTDGTLCLGSGVSLAEVTLMLTAGTYSPGTIAALKSQFGAKAVTVGGAASGTYVWTGGGSDGNWSNPANWGRDEVIAWSNSDYALFEKDGQVVVDQVVNLFQVCVTGDANVTIVGGEGGTLRFNSSTTLGGILADDSSVVTVSVPVEMTTSRQELRGSGTVKFVNGSYTISGATATYNSARTQVYSTGSVVDFSGKTGGALAFAFAGEADVTIEEDARLVLPGLTFYNGTSTMQNMTIRQKGSSEVSVAGDMKLKDAPTAAGKMAHYYLDGGTLTVAGRLILASQATGDNVFRQQGGTSNLGGIDLSCGKVFLEGGTMNLAGAVSGGQAFEVKGGTLNVGENASFADGVTLSWNGTEGTLVLSEGQTLGNATLMLTEGTYTSADIAALKAKYRPKAVTLGAGATVNLYVWTGAAGDGKWSSSANWGLDDGYPDGECDEAIFETDATVVFDRNEPVSLRRVWVKGENRTVRILLADDCMDGVLTFVHGYDGYASGLTVDSATSTLEVGVPTHGMMRMDSSGGKVVYKSKMTFDSSASGQRMFFLPSEGVFSDGADIDMTKVGQNPSFGFQGTKFRIEGDAKMTLASFSIGMISSSSRDVEFVQDGADSKVKANYNFLVNEGASGGKMHYTLKNGTVEVADTLYASMGSGGGEFVQEGGTATVRNITLNGGDVILKGGTMNVSGRIQQGTGGGRLLLRGGTLALDAAGEIGVPVVYEGSGSISGSLAGVTVVVPAGEYTVSEIELIRSKFAGAVLSMEGVFLKVTLTEDLSWAELLGTLPQDVDCTFVLGSDGKDVRTVTIDAETSLLKSLVIGDKVAVKTVRDVDIVPDESGAVPSLTINGGGWFGLDSQYSRLLTPIHLAINGTGYFDFNCNGSEYARAAVVAYSYIVDGEVKARGKYTASKNGSGPLRDRTGNCQLFVPYVWTGGGDGKTISDTGNWQDGAWSTWTSAVPLDFSQAMGDIEVAGDYRSGGFSYLPSANGSSVRLRGTTESSFLRTYTADGDLYPQAICRKGCVIELNVNYELVDGKKRRGFVGGGIFRFDKACNNFTYSNEGMFLVDGQIEIAGTVSGNYLNWSPLHNLNGAMRFDDGATVTLQKALSLPVDGFFSAPGFVQDGGAVSAPYLALATARTDGMQQCFYELNGGTLSLSEALFVGVGLPDGYYMPTADPAAMGTFRMNGGTLTTGGVQLLGNSNFCELLGGHVTIGADGFSKGAGTVKTPNATPPIVLGAVTLHATEASWSVSADLSTETVPAVSLRGGTVFDVAEGLTVTLNGPLTGEGGIVKKGAGELILVEGYAAKGTITIEEGRLNLAEGVNNVTLVADSLSDIDLTGSTRVSGLVVGGVVKSYGTYAIAGGKTLSVEPPSDSFIWIGPAEGGNWLDPSNWREGNVPNGLTADVDFGLVKTTVSEINVNGAVSVRNLILTDDLMLSGTGTATFGDGAEIFVPEGKALRITGLAALAGAASKTGTGAIAFDGNVSGASLSTCGLAVRSGAAEFAAEVGGVSVYGCGVDKENWPVITLRSGCRVIDTAEVVPVRAEENVSSYGKVVQNGATVCHANSALNLMNPNGGEGVYQLESGILDVGKNVLALQKNYNDRGTLTFIQNGGIVTVDSVTMLRCALNNATGRLVRYVLNGGTLQTLTNDKLDGGIVTGVDQSANPAWLAACSVLELNGGTLKAASCPFFNPKAVSVRLEGSVTFEAGAADVASMLTAAPIGGGTLRLAAGSGTVVIGEGCDFSGLGLSIAEGKKVNLAFSGVKTVRSLILRGVSKFGGVYDASTESDLLMGPGALVVPAGTAPTVDEGNATIAVEGTADLDLGTQGLTVDKEYAVTGGTVRWTDKKSGGTTVQFAIMVGNRLTVKAGKPANGLDSFVSHVLGLDPTEPLSLPAAEVDHSATQTEEDGYALHFPAVHPDPSSGYSVFFQRQKKVDGKWKNDGKLVPADGKVVIPFDGARYRVNTILK